MRTHYATLGGLPSSSANELYHQYLRLMMVHHPDRGGEHAQAAEITEAWSVLGDQKKRRAYDEKLALENDTCENCKAKGKITTGFRAGASKLCPQCRGVGYFERESVSRSKKRVAADAIVCGGPTVADGGQKKRGSGKAK